MADINLNVGANTRDAERAIQRLVNKSYNINLRTRGDQPLGRITGQVNEFTKSLDASNARVIAFGASAGIIYGVERAFGALVSSIIDVQKSLKDINVILNVSSSELAKFGGGLFDIAKNTGQSFDEVAKAATEFSRQGLGVTETLKRTNEALILARLSGLDTVKSVEALTAAVNSFASQAVTATEVVNKFATVDAAFAVSSADLAEAIARVGSSAAQSGVSLDELIAVVTSAQQTTARGGAVIGNSFKTIFTRLQRSKVIGLLESLGIDTNGADGQIKSTIQLLQDLAKVYDTLGQQQQSAVAEAVGGVFQINILKSALADLGKEYSIYNNALEISGTATDQAIRRNEELNKTYAAQLNALRENARQAGSSVGERVLGPLFDRTVGNANTLLGTFNESDGKGVGAVLGKGILDGIGQVIAGPGLILIGGVLIKLFKDLTKFAAGSFQQLLGLNTASTQQKDLQQSINKILADNPKLLKLALQGEQGLNQAASALLANLRNQTVELQKQAAVAAQMSRAFYGAGVRVKGGVPVAPGKAAGFIPNFADAEIMAAKSERYNAQRSFEVNNPVLGRITVNNREKTNAIPVGGYPAGSLVVNPNQLGQVKGIPLEPIEKMKNKASGFIPNFSKTGKEYLSTGSTSSLKELQKRITKESQYYGYLIPSNNKSDNTIAQGSRQIKKGGPPVVFPASQAFAPKIKKAAQNSDGLEDKVINRVVDEAAAYTARLDPPGVTVSTSKLRQSLDSAPGARGALQSAVGAAFETAIISALNYEAANRREGGDFDVRGGTGLSKVKELFNIPGNIRAADFKSSISPGNITSFRDKIIKELRVGGEFSEKERMANAQKDAEKQINKSKYPLLFQKGGRRSTSLKTPESAAQQKKYDEELRELTQKRYQSTYAYAAGFIPNFAAPLVRAIDDRELRMMLSKFAKGGSFENISPDSYGSDYGPGTATYMWDAFGRPNASPISDRQAYKQNFGNAKKWSSSTGANWLVRFNRNKLDNSELLPDMNNRNASVYLKALSKDQIIWPIKPANVSGKKIDKRWSRGIFEKDVPAFLSGQINNAIKRGRAAGFIPNFSASQTNKGVPISSNNIRAHFDKDGNPIAVTNVRDEPNGLKDAIKREKRGIGMPGPIRGSGLASGFIPNFAVDDTASSGDVVGALSVQMATVLPMMALMGQRGEEYAKSLERITEENKKAGKVTGALSKAQKDANTRLVAMGQITREEAKARGQAGKYGPTTGQKLGAKLGDGTGAAFAVSLIAPIIAETLSQGIDKSTKEGRAKAAGTSALGTTVSLAATGFALGGPVGLAVGTVAGAAMGLSSYLNELSTELPELREATKSAAEELTKFGDFANAVLTTIEKAADLRKSGQVEKAAELESDVIERITQEIGATNPELAARVLLAIDKNDFDSLRKALNENTDALTKVKQEKQLAEDIQTAVEGLRDNGPEGKVGKLNADFLAQQLFKRTGGLEGGLDQDKLDKLISQIRLANEAAAQDPGGQVPGLGAVPVSRTPKPVDPREMFLEAGIGPEMYDDIFALIGDDAQALSAVFQSYKERTANAETLQERLNKELISNSAALSSASAMIDQLSDPFTKLSKAVQGNIEVTAAYQSAVDAAYWGLRPEFVKIESDVTKTFGGKEQSRQLDIRAKRYEDQDKVNKAIVSNEIAVEEILKSAIVSGLQKGAGDLKSFSGDETDTGQRALDQVAEAERIANRIAGLGSVEGSSGIDLVKDSEGFIDFIATSEGLLADLDFQKLGTEEQTKILNSLESTINKNNVTLQNLLIEQKKQNILLANQQFAELTKEFAEAVKGSFGGLEAFSKGKPTDKTFADALNSNIAERKAIRDAAERDRVPGQQATMTEESIIEYGRRASQQLDLLETVLGRSGVFNPGTDLVQQEIAGQAANLKKLYEQLEAAGTGPNAAQSDKEAFEIFRRALVQQSGFTGGEIGSDMTEVVRKVAEIQALARRETGQVDLSIQNAAYAELARNNPELAELLKYNKETGNVGVDISQFGPDTLLMKNSSTQVTLLEDIRTILAEGRDNVNVGVAMDEIQNSIQNDAYSSSNIDFTDFQNGLEGANRILQDMWAFSNLDSNSMYRPMENTNTASLPNINVSNSSSVAINIDPSNPEGLNAAKIQWDEAKEREWEDIIAKVATVESTIDTIKRKNPGMYNTPPKSPTSKFLDTVGQ